MILLVTNLFMPIILLCLKKLRQILNHVNLNLMIESKLLAEEYFGKGYSDNWWKEIFVIDSVLQINPWPYKIKDLNEEKIIGSFYEKELLLSKLKVSYYPETESHIRYKVKIVLKCSNYATEKIGQCYRY